MLNLKNLMESAIADTSGNVMEAQKQVIDKFVPAIEGEKLQLGDISLREAFDSFCDVNGVVDRNKSTQVAEAISGSQFPYFTEKVLVPIIKREYEWALDNILSLCTEDTTTKQTVNIPGLGNFYGPEKVGSLMEYPHDTAQDNMCTIKMHKYGHIIDLSREAILADDFGLIRSRARSAGKYMGRLVHEIGIKKLINATTISINGESTNTSFVYNGTGYAHFSDDHSSIDGQTNDNIDTTAFSDAGIKALHLLLAKMKDDRGKPSPISPKVLMVPAALWEDAVQLVNSDRVYSNANNNINVWKGMFSLFSSAYFDATSATLYYLGDPKQGFYLIWRQKPTTEVAPSTSDDAFKRDVVLAYKHWAEFNFGLLDYRVVARGGS